MRQLQNLIHLLGKVCGWIGCVVLFVMMMLMVIDIALRFVLNKPILGGYELVEILMAIVVGVGFAYTQSCDGHVRVTMFIDPLPDRIKAVLDALTLLVGAVMMSIVAYAGIVQGGLSAGQGQTTTVLAIPLYPFYYLLGVGFIVYALVMLIDALSSLVGAVNPDYCNVPKKEII